MNRNLNLKGAFEQIKYLDSLWADVQVLFNFICKELNVFAITHIIVFKVELLFWVKQRVKEKHWYIILHIHLHMFIKLI